LLSEWRSSDGRVDRERIDRARQQAESLFKPQQQAPRQDVQAAAANPDPTTGPEPRRQPRIFRIPPLVPMGAASSETQAPPPDRIRRRRAARRNTTAIPTSQFGRVRALANYGMTQAQVAELYGVGVEEIERIIGQSDPSPIG
jgi:hypothetical protein